MAFCPFNPMQDLINLYIEYIVEETKNLLFKMLLKEDTGEIRSGGHHQTIAAKSKLQEIEKYINCASYMLARGISGSSALEWMTAAQPDAFCLEDQIAMYANRDFGDRIFYAMKRAIGMFSVDELTKKIQAHIDKMPMDLQIMSKISENSRFVRYSHPVTADKILGMDEETKRVHNFLESEDNGCKVLFIIGQEGSGKTTLMDRLYEVCDVKLRSRVNVSETIGLVGFLKAVLEGSTADLEPGATDEFKILEKIHETFKAEYLIVLDDVQDTSMLYSLMHVLKDSNGKIIVLTRRTDIVNSLDAAYTVDGRYEEVRIPPLDEKNSRRLLRLAAFPEYTGSATENDNDLMAPLSGLPAAKLATMKDTLNDILCRCEGNPWNIWTVGKILSSYDLEDWRGIREQIDVILIRLDDTNRDPLINTEEDKSDPPIKLEAAKLEDSKSPGDVRLGFLYCLAFPDNSEIPENAGIPKRKLTRLWMAEGFLQGSPHKSQEQEAEDLLQELIKRELLVVKKKSFDGEVLKCRVNKNIRPLAMEMCETQKFCQFLSTNGHEASSNTSRRANHSSASSSSNISPPKRKKALSARYRMLAVHGDGGVNTASKALAKDIRLRSLLYFRTGTTERQKLELSFQSRYKLLRTLELQGAHLDRLPSSIGCLVCLRYLGLRGTQLEYLPPSWQRLEHLMCLDIRDTNITTLKDVSTFTEMRHLLLANSFRERSVHILNGLKFLIYLQTLSGAKHGGSSDLEHLQFLSKLSIKKAPSASAEDMCRAISKMEFLRSLTITADGEKFAVKYLKIGRNLHKLKLGGDMGALCDHRLFMMRSITYLYLWDSNLQDDPIFTLQGLKHLLLLSLCNAYSGAELHCTSGYHKLKKLSIISMEHLTKCIFESEAMKKLEELVFAKCGQLQGPPDTLEHNRQSLREVHLTQMLPDFCKQMKAILGDEKVKVVEMDFLKSTRAANEGSQPTATESTAPPATTEGSQVPADEPIPAPATIGEISIVEGSQSTSARTPSN